MKLVKLSASVVAVAAIAGCANISDEARDLIDAVANAEELEFYDEGEGPEGKAEMSGFMAAYYAAPGGEEEEEELKMGFHDDRVAVGALKMTADFDAATIDGDAKDFVEFEVPNSCGVPLGSCDLTETQKFDGDLKLTGTIEDAWFGWEAEGELTGDFGGAAEETAAVEAAGEGQFFKADGVLTAAGGGGGGFATAGGPEEFWAELLAQED